MTIHELGNVTFIALETFRKNGEGVITPVWVTGENNKLYIWTEVDSWKIKRIRNNPKVRICQSDARGNPKSEWLEAQAQVLDSDDAREKAKEIFKSKYGLQFRMFSVVGRSNPKAVVEISAP
jgi:uncharacterized protein